MVIDIGVGVLSVETIDKWTNYDPQQMDVVEKHINALR